MKIKCLLKYIILSTFLLLLTINATSKKTIQKRNAKISKSVQKQKSLEEAFQLTKEGDNSFKVAKSITTNKNDTTTINLFYDAALKFITAAKQFATNKKPKYAFDNYQKAIQSLESIDRKNGTPTDFFFDYLIVFETKIKANSMAEKAHIKKFETYFLKKDVDLIKTIYKNNSNKKSIKAAWEKRNKIFFTYKSLKKELNYIDSFLE